MLGKKIKAGYESDTTKMIRELLEKRPQILDDRQRGRSMWWDKRLDADGLRRDRESDLKQPAYVYQNYGD